MNMTAIDRVSANGFSSVLAAEGVNTSGERAERTNMERTKAVNNPVQALTVSDGTMTQGNVLAAIAEKDDSSSEGLVKQEHVEGDKQTNVVPGDVVKAENDVPNVV